LSNDIRDWYLALTDPSKQIFLALVSHTLQFMVAALD
jgi:hypothetical protein